MAEANGSVADGLVGMVNVFVDPQTTAQKVPSPFSWLWPVAVLVIGYGVFGYLMMPYSMQMVEATMRQQNLPPEQAERAIAMSRTFGMVGAYTLPVILIAFIALFALLVKVVYWLNIGGYCLSNLPLSESKVKWPKSLCCIVNPSTGVFVSGADADASTTASARASVVQTTRPDR